MKKAIVFSKSLLIIGLVIAVLQTGCRKEIEPVVLTSEELLSAKADEARSILNVSDSYVVESWYNLLNRLIISTPGQTPPIAAREIGYIGIALYEAAAGGLFLHPSLAGQLNGLSSLPRRQPRRLYIHQVSANASLARIIKSLFGNASAANIASIDSLESANYRLHAFKFSVGIMNLSRDFGYAIGDAIFEWSKTDGGHQAYLNVFPATYIPTAGSGLWVPTPALFQPAMLPYWGSNRNFVPGNNPGEVDPPAPPSFSTITNSKFYREAYKVFKTVNNLTQEQKDIANYWADGSGTFTPPGHNISMAVQLIRNKNLGLGQASVLLAAIGIALNDAAIVCWRCKFNFNLLRPVTYIKTYIDPNWTSYIGTPPFPAYTSGHSTFSGATAKILSLRFGNHFAFTDSTKVPYGIAPRSFKSFEQAAREAARSRLYGGIHYEFDNDEGLRCGILIGNNVAKLKWQ